MMMRLLRLGVGLLIATLAAGCAQTKTKSTDYSAYKQSRPRSIVVLPPLNESPDVKATYGMLSQLTYPLAEAGYYVVPVALMDETFRLNGLTMPGDIHQVAPQKLQEIFGADAALYVTVTQYGTSYMVLSSTTVVTASAKLVDLKSGATLWTGSASASSDENQVNAGGLIGMLVSAAVHQIVSQVRDDAAYPVAGTAGQRLLSAGRNAGLLYGPRSPKYGTD